MKPICRIFLRHAFFLHNDKKKIFLHLNDHNNNVLKIGFISLCEALFFVLYVDVPDSIKRFIHKLCKWIFVRFSQRFTRWCWTNRRSCWILDCVLCCHDKREVQLFSFTLALMFSYRNHMKFIYMKHGKPVRKGKCLGSCCNLRM